MNLNIRNQQIDRAKPNMEFSWVADMHQQLQQASIPKEEVKDVCHCKCESFNFVSFW
jgi:hypothetical protein